MHTLADNSGGPVAVHMPDICTEAQERFSFLIANGESAVDSHFQAFPDLTENRATRHVMASLLRAKVGHRIAFHRARVQAERDKFGHESIASKLELEQFHTRAMRAPLALTELDSDLIQEITTTTRRDADGSETIKQTVKLPSKQGATQELAKLAGHYASERLDVTGSVEITGVFSKVRQSNGIVLDEMGECITDYSALLD